MGFFTPASAGANETVIYNFTCGSDGCGPTGPGPVGPLVRDASGNFYGTASSGNNSQCSGGGGVCGYVYELSPDGSGGWTETTIYSFQGGKDGADPTGGLIMDAAGNLYGVTTYGGSLDCRNTRSGCGTVFELSKSGSSWTETILSNFQNGTRGAYPEGGLVFDQQGNLYGTTNGGGPNTCNQDNQEPCGLVFELSPSSQGWAETVLYNFKPEPDASSPYGSLVFDPSGRLYGIAGNGAYGEGSVYRLKRSSTGWVENVIWNFTGGEDGNAPQGILAYNGGIYGTTVVGGNFHVGTVFELTPGVASWNLNVIHTFTGSDDGGEPQAGLTQAGSKLFGTTSLGGLYEYGTVFRLNPPANDGSWTEDVLYNFPGGAPGANPNNPLTAGPNSLFGSINNYTQALVYEISLN